MPHAVPGSMLRYAIPIYAIARLLAAIQITVVLLLYVNSNVMLMRIVLKRKMRGGLAFPCALLQLVVVRPRLNATPVFLDNVPALTTGTVVGVTA